ncbi:MAG TPA: 30S ribosomal protein S16 [Dehalococcoidales bacterium]|nr:30S ribosomal protein S16 [Dehalococcoidales bacterium]
MLKIRLRRVGAKHRPSYRLVIADSKAPRDGAFLNIIGHYDPLKNPEVTVIDEEQALKWLRQGAQPTATVARLLSKAGIMEKVKTVKEKT